MSKRKLSKTHTSKLYKLPETVFSRVYSFDSRMKSNRPSTRSHAAHSHITAYDGKGASFSSPPTNLNNSSKNEIGESVDFESRSVQELENYAVNRAEETTQKINGCVRVAEEIRGVSSRALGNLHQQGEQITATHITAVNIDHELTRSEKLLGSLGGLFSRAWKPKKSREIKGPDLLSKDDSFMKNMEHRLRFGLRSSGIPSNPRPVLTEPSPPLKRVEMEKIKQDDALSDLSDLMVELKSMAVDLGYEIERQNMSLDHMQDDVVELNLRVRDVNLRTRRLLGR